MAGRRQLCGVAFAVLTSVAWPAVSLAYRPFTTEDAGVAGKGVAQLELSWDHLRWRNGDEEHLLLAAAIYGLTDRLELSLEIPHLIRDPADDDSHAGIADVSLVGKYLLLRETETRPALAVKGVVKTNSGNAEQGLGSGDWDVGGAVAVSKTLGRLALHAMLGYTVVGDGGNDDVRNIALYGVAADYRVTGAFHLVAEVAGNQHPDRTVRTDPVSVLVGVTYALLESWVIDAGVRRGVTRSAPAWDVFTGLSLSF